MGAAILFVASLVINFATINFAAAQNLSEIVSSETASPEISAPLESTPRKSSQLILVPLTATEHLWGGFSPGAAIQTRTVTKTRQENKNKDSDDDFVRSVSENRVILDAVDEHGVTLKVFSVVGLSARRYKAPPVTQRLDFFQYADENEKLTHEELPAVSIDVAGTQVECQVRHYRRKSPKWRQETAVYYTNTLYPYVMRTETTRWNMPTETAPRETILSQTVTRVLQTAAIEVRSKHFGTFTIETVKNQGDTKTVGILRCLLNVPGGVISESIREIDASGKVVREVETVLKGYTGLRASSPLEAMISASAAAQSKSSSSHQSRREIRVAQQLNLINSARQLDTGKNNLETPLLPPESE